MWRSRTQFFRSGEKRHPAVLWRPFLPVRRPFRSARRCRRWRRPTSVCCITVSNDRDANKSCRVYAAALSTLSLSAAIRNSQSSKHRTPSKQITDSNESNTKSDAGRADAAPRIRPALPIVAPCSSRCRQLCRRARFSELRRGRVEAALAIHHPWPALHQATSANRFRRG